MEGQRVPGSLQSITDSQPKYNGNGLKITVFVQFRPFGRAPGRLGLSFI